MALFYPSCYPVESVRDKELTAKAEAPQLLAKAKRLADKADGGAASAAAKSLALMEGGKSVHGEEELGVAAATMGLSTPVKKGSSGYSPTVGGGEGSSGPGSPSFIAPSDSRRGLLALSSGDASTGG